MPTAEFPFAQKLLVNVVPVAGYSNWSAAHRPQSNQKGIQLQEPLTPQFLLGSEDFFCFVL